MNQHVPSELRTPRLLLRRYRETDVPDFFNLLQINQERFSVAFPERLALNQQIEGAGYFVRQMIAAWQSRKAYEFGIWRQETGQYIGDIALKNFEKRVPKAEIGYYLDGAAEGQGYASEALRAVTTFGFDHVGLNKIFIKMTIQNHRSYRLAERCGYVREGMLRQDFRSDEKTGLVNIYYYGLIRSDYEKLFKSA